MLKTLRGGGHRRRPGIGGAQLCAVSAAVLLLLSLAILHSRLGSFGLGLGLGLMVQTPPLPENLISPVESLRDEAAVLDLLADEENEKDEPSVSDTEDLIDEFDNLEEGKTDEEEEDDELGRNENSEEGEDAGKKNSGYFWDHVSGVTRRAFDKQTAEEDKLGFSSDLSLEDRSRSGFASDDQPLDEKIRQKLDEVMVVEDALLFKTRGGASALRDGWAPWFDQKGVFLRKERMFRSNFERLNPLNNPLLQDPDMPGVTSLTKGDRILQKAMWKEIRKVPFGGSKLQQLSTSKHTRRETLRKLNSEVYSQTDSKKPIYADGRRWGYYPGLDPHLSFAAFMDEFFSRKKCSLRVFMVWNSPTWMFGVRHQRGLESVLHNHPDACVVVFSETIELDFFNDFVKDGFKVAVVMPNLDELLKNTPVHVFASVWHKWRKIPLYSIHYSELVRLAALYKYGGVYLDSDVIVLNPLNSLKNSIAVEDQMTNRVTYNGAVMVFKRHSPFIMECLKEYYSTYDDTRLRWNGAHLLTRVRNRLRKWDSPRFLGLKTEPSFSFFPISPRNITRYFAAPADEAERAQQDALYRKILDESFTFHFWNSLTYAFVPEPESLVERLLNHHCLRCLDLL
ncbi:hypothetical protein H6P81_019136 [Aristolochia fimbriata]|uniref:Alpha 1,4-glycosyltransferase domain-containing protein n=1 Tax=Aristolochia fimbriata TaxID=158543 RepID=A0AAV7DTW9_ARIFI|nr:hypothetical protein H6P81_019136 [Aristolochia fimbriata]